MAAVNVKSLDDDKVQEFLNSFDTVLTDCDGMCLSFLSLD